MTWPVLIAAGAYRSRGDEDAINPFTDDKSGGEPMHKTTPEAYLKQ
jgi:hypothetical protein